MKFRSSSWLSLSSHKVVVAAPASFHRSPCFDSESLVSVDAYFSAIEGYGYEYFLVGVDGMHLVPLCYMLLYAVFVEFWPGLLNGGSPGFHATILSLTASALWAGFRDCLGTESSKEGKDSCATAL